MGVDSSEVEARYPPAAAGVARIPSMPSPPASPPLHSVAAGFDVEAGKDRPAGSSVLPNPPTPGISRTNTTILHELNASTPGAHDSEYDPLLLRAQLLGDDEIELRRRNTQSKKKSSGKKLGKCVY